MMKKKGWATKTLTWAECDGLGREKIFVMRKQDPAARSAVRHGLDKSGLSVTRLVKAAGTKGSFNTYFLDAK